MTKMFCVTEIDGEPQNFLIPLKRTGNTTQEPQFVDGIKIQVMCQYFSVLKNI